MPCSFAGASAPGIYSIDGCERDICVTYSSTNGRPIRVQIYGPIMVDGCPQPGTRVVKVDSAWRCEECCDCPETSPRSNDPRDCQGGGKGKVEWTKPDGVTSIEVVVLTACGAVYTLDIQACDECEPQPDPGPCFCEDDDDCAPGCACVDGECVPGENGACCVCPVSNHPYDHLSNEFLGATFWETEAEANSAADDVVSLCEELRGILAANGYCNAEVVVDAPRIRQDFKPFLDPPRQVWELMMDFARVTAKCCGTEEGAQIGPKWPGTNVYPFGNISPCVQGEVIRNCLDGMSNDECDEACGIFHAGKTCEEDPCNPLP
jgi:hypothetical protein